jgi:uncharacterized protein YcnI
MSRIVSSIVLLSGLMASEWALAHVSFLKDVNNIPSTGKSIVATLNVPHGCHDTANKSYDTNKIEVKMPQDVQLSSIMPVHSTFGKVKIVKDNAGKITSLIWEQKAEDVQTEASHFYQVSFRVTLSKITTAGTVALTPFTTLGFETIQYCGDNDQLYEEWAGADTPTLYVVPARSLGWNKYIVPSVLDLTGTGKNFFTDAAIVWKDKEGYSINSNTLELIKKNATELKQIPAGSTVWVKY